jgi:hypothetical protein
MSTSRGAVAAWIAAVAAVAVPLLIFAMGRETRALSYEIVGPLPMVSIDLAATGELEVTYKGRILGDPQVFAIRIENAGNSAIKPADFERDLRLAFAPQAELVSAEIVRRHPSTLTPAVRVAGTVVCIEPLLLNPGDWFSMLACVADSTTAPALDARIAGVREPTQETSGTTPLPPLGFNVVVALAAALAYFYTGGMAVRLAAYGRSRRLRTIGIELLIVAIVAGSAFSKAIIRVAQALTVTRSEVLWLYVAGFVVASPLFLVGTIRGRQLCERGHGGESEDMGAASARVDRNAA